MKKFAALILSLCLLLPGCSTGGTDENNPQTAQPDSPEFGDYTVTKNEPLQLQTAHYDGGFFSLMLPDGWVIETTGEYTNFGLLASPAALHLPGQL